MSEEYFFRAVNPEVYLENASYQARLSTFHEFNADQKKVVIEIIDGLTKINSANKESATIKSGQVTDISKLEQKTKS